MKKNVITLLCAVAIAIVCFTMHRLYHSLQSSRLLFSMPIKAKRLQLAKIYSRSRDSPAKSGHSEAVCG